MQAYICIYTCIGKAKQIVTELVVAVVVGFFFIAWHEFNCIGIETAMWLCYWL